MQTWLGFWFCHCYWPRLEFRFGKCFCQTGFLMCCENRFSIVLSIYSHFQSISSTVFLSQNLNSSPIKLFSNFVIKWKKEQVFRPFFIIRTQINVDIWEKLKGIVYKYWMWFLYVTCKCFLHSFLLINLCETWFEITPEKTSAKPQLKICQFEYNLRDLKQF